MNWKEFFISKKIGILVVTLFLFITVFSIYTIISWPIQCSDNPNLPECKILPFGSILFWYTISMIVYFVIRVVLKRLLIKKRPKKLINFGLLMILMIVGIFCVYLSFPEIYSTSSVPINTYGGNLYAIGEDFLQLKTDQNYNGYYFKLVDDNYLTKINEDCRELVNENERQLLMFIKNNARDNADAYLNSLGNLQFKEAKLNTTNEHIFVYMNSTEVLEYDKQLIIEIACEFDQNNKAVNIFTDSRLWWLGKNT